MYKRGGWALWVSIALAIVLFLGLFLYFVLSGPDYSRYYKELQNSREIKNPAEGMIVEEAAKAFDKNFVYYLLFSLEAYNLHNPPLSSDRPRILLFVGDKIYNAVIDSGKIIVEEGDIVDEDIIIKTSVIEAVGMMNNRDYVVKSFDTGASSIELVAPKSVLFGKGYLKIYDKVKGEGITGSVIGMYLS